MSNGLEQFYQKLEMSLTNLIGVIKTIKSHRVVAQSIIRKLDNTINTIQNHQFEDFLLSIISILGLMLGYSMQQMTDLIGTIVILILMLLYFMFCVSLLCQYIKSLVFK